MRDQFLATRTEIEVLADGALVTRADNRENSAAIALKLLMSDMRIVRLNIFHHTDDLSKSISSFLVKLSLNVLLHTSDQTERHFLAERALLKAAL